MWGLHREGTEKDGEFRMTNKERLQAVENRLDGILEIVPDNAIYEDHESRAILNYLQAQRILKEIIEKEGENRWPGQS